MSDSLIVLITGANSGIGFETAKLLASSGNYTVIITSRSLEKGQEALKELQSASNKGTVSLMQLDVVDEKSVEAAAKHVESEFGRLDVLINNAGINLTGMRQEPKPPASDMIAMLSTNSVAPVVVTHAFLPLLQKSAGARVIYISSSLGSISMRETDVQGQPPGLWGYRMSKTALNMVMAITHKMYGDWMKTWCICPGLVATNLADMKAQMKEMGAGDPAVSAQTVKDTIDGKRDGDVGKFIHKDGIYPW